jgi:15-cis-phytoene desaturase
LVPNTVAVLGGGVGGLSAALELIERGFHVEVYERKPVMGGKARSIPVAGSGTGGRRDLPGEHGFRFFPGFYKHVIDTMRRIPDGAGRNTFDNLATATRILLARGGQADITWVARSPQNLEDLRVFLCELFTPLGVPPAELTFFVSRLLVLATSCTERRFAVYENLKWWDYIAAQQMSAIYQRYLGEGLTRSLVAMRAQEGSTRTVGYILLQLLYDLICPGQVFDRLLDGPTNDVWLNPWVDYLQRLGVIFHNAVQVNAFELEGGRIRSVNAAENGNSIEIAADWYIAAMPVEVMSALLSPALIAAAPSLANLGRLETRWMNGIQFYLRKDVSLVPGHTIYLDSPWALTSVSQHQFWTGVDLSSFGDGNVAGILSVDISEWQEPGVLYNKTAMQCTANEIKEEVWVQLKQHLNVAGAVQLDDADLITWFLDPDIQFPNPTAATNLEPLMINTAGSLQYRPEAQVEIPNLFLASDYVRTYTDLATMEAANEAARRAVNCLLAAAGSTAQPAQIWPLTEPEFLRPLQEIDRIRFSLGQPHHLS